MKDRLAPAQNLAEQLAAFKAGFKHRANSERLTITEAATAQLKASGIETRAPVPATFVIGRDGRFAFTRVDADYRERAEPADVMRVVHRLCGQGPV